MEVIYALGSLLDKFMIVGDSILSTYISEDGQYSGTEFLIQVDEKTYNNRGFAFKGNEKLSSWEVQLSKVE